jgi:hypothetical protein
MTADEASIRQRQSERRWSAIPDTVIADGVEMRIIKPPPPSITVEADDGTELLRVSITDDGRLDVSGAEDRWTEAAARFVAEMRRLLADS